MPKKLSSNFNQIMNIEFVFEVVLVIIFGSFGVIGNILLIKRFVYTEQKVNFHKLMITLAVYDTLYIVLNASKYFSCRKTQKTQ